jgi:hypothetical protein
MQPRDGREGRPTLASLDFLGEPDRLWADSQPRAGTGGAGRWGSTTAEISGHQYGADRSNAVRVQVDARGRVETVDIDLHWRERVAVAGFAAAVFEAYAEALRKTYQIAARTALRAGRPATAARPTVIGQRSPVEDPATDPAPREWARRTRATLDEIGAELDQLAGRRPTDGGPERTVVSPRGCLTLRLRGQQLTAVDGDPRRIGAAGPEQLRLDLLAAFRAAELSTRT